jgi:hypothetical protein
MSDKDQILMDRLMRDFFGDRYPGATARPSLRAVTAENAHEFTPAPRKRGRPRRIDARDNVVPIGSRRSLAALPVTPGVNALAARFALAEIETRHALGMSAQPFPFELWEQVATEVLLLPKPRKPRKTK